jgi:TrpR-related protein YerC/YecD
MGLPTTMATDSTWLTDDTRALLAAIVTLGDVDDAADFLRDLCTLGELHDMGQRWAVVRLLDAGMHYSEISRRTGASTATITRIASWLRHGEGGYRRMLDRLAEQSGAGTGAYPAGDER